MLLEEGGDFVSKQNQIAVSLNQIF